MAVYNKKEILEMYDNDTLKHISLFPLGLSIFDDGIIVDRYHNIIDKTASIQKMNLQKGFLRVAAKITNITVSAIYCFFFN